MFCKYSKDGYRQAVDGIQMKTLVYGDRTLLSEFHLEKGSHLPRHTHPHEQTGYLISGRIRFTIGKDVLEAGSGDSWCIPGNIEHQADILENSVAIEVFSPVREDYLPTSQP
ncbi:MAG: cupin domain-containing protein [Desulfatirhabdiaceae bacterium]